MTEEQFRQRARDQGHCEFFAKDYGPDKDGPLHQHDFSVMLWVVRGQFSLAFEDGTTDYLPGDMCDLAANVSHAERAGPMGASVLLAKPGSGASPTPT